MELASNLEDVAKKRKKVSWIMLDCQHELHKNIDYKSAINGALLNTLCTTKSLRSRSRM